MWDTVVSFGAMLLQHIVEVFWQHPIVGTAFITTQSVLTILFGLEVLSGFRIKKPADARTDVQPMRLRR